MLVKGIPYKSSESEIQEFFATIGKVDSINLLKNHDKTSKGIAFVRFVDEASMNAAIDKSGATFEERKLFIEKTKPRGERDARDTRGGDRGGDRRDRDRDSRRYDRSRSRDRDRRRSRDRKRSRSSSSRGSRSGSGSRSRSDSRSNDRPKSTTVFVGNLNFSTNERGLRDFFEDCGGIRDVRINTNPDGRVSLCLISEQGIRPHRIQ